MKPDHTREWGNVRAAGRGAEGGDRYHMTFGAEDEAMHRELTYEKEPYGDIELWTSSCVVVNMEN